ncbi:MAG: SRPBCC domain-containing protein, partial [Candidatus Limnocylindrales bacterium]
EGHVLAVDPPQHVSFSWDYPDEPLGAPSVVAFDAIEHGQRTHLTVRQVGLVTVRSWDLHDALWRYWFPRLVQAATRGMETAPAG